MSLLSSHPVKFLLGWFRKCTKKQDKSYFLITSVIYALHIIIAVPHLVNGMVLQNPLLQKSMRYKRHKETKLHQESGRRYYTIGIRNQEEKSIFTRFKDFESK